MQETGRNESQTTLCELGSWSKFNTHILHSAKRVATIREVMKEASKKMNKEEGERESEQGRREERRSPDE
jgi:hypothetical protein